MKKRFRLSRNWTFGEKQTLRDSRRWRFSLVIVLVAAAAAVGGEAPESSGITLRLAAVCLI